MMLHHGLRFLFISVDFILGVKEQTCGSETRKRERVADFSAPKYGIQEFVEITKVCLRLYVK